MKANELQKEFINVFRSLLTTRHAWDAWSDWLVLASTCLRNSPIMDHDDEAEAEYMRVAGKYDREELNAAAKLLAITVEALAEPHDFLGAIFHELELHNSAHGQFFTPYELCRMMAAQTLHDGAPHPGVIRIHEPACGSGAMVISMHEVSTRQGWADRAYYELQDLDDRAFRMAYIQCSLLGLAAVVKRGNTLSMAFDRAWMTPGYYLNCIGLRMAQENRNAKDDTETTESAGDGPAPLSDPAQPAMEDAEQLSFAL